MAAMAMESGTGSPPEVSGGEGSSSPGGLLQEHVGSQSQALRRMAQKNALERTAFVEQKKRLELQRKNKQVELDREERDLRDQLQRLQEERAMLADVDEQQDDAASETFSEYEFGSSPLSPCPLLTSFDDVVDPYPITITPRLFGSGRPTKSPMGDRGDGKKSGTRRSRPLSSDFTDLDIAGPGSRLPPLQPCGKFLTPADGSATNLSPTDSLSSLKSLSPKDKKEFWVGNPEAISSVRRARKTPSQQRKEHQWSRSQSLKERPLRSLQGNESASSLLQSSGVVSRSNSMKDRAGRRGLIRSTEPVTGSSSGTASPQQGMTGKGWSRSNSLKDSTRTVMTSIESLEESMTSMEVKPRRTKSLKVKSGHTPSSQTPSPRLGAYSPNTKSAVWRFGEEDTAAKTKDGGDNVERTHKPLARLQSPSICIESPSPLPPISPGAGIDKDTV